MNKIPVECNDYPGFVSNRILMPMINESVFCLEQGVATKEAIDDIMTLGMAHPMGPVKLADLIGLDICLNIMHVLFDSFKDNLFKSMAFLRKKVPLFEAGFISGSLYARADLLVPVGDEWDIVEVKSGTSVKEINLYDLAFQKYCYESKGLKIRKASTIGSGSVVLSTVREGITVLGNPAKRLKIPSFDE